MEKDEKRTMADAGECAGVSEAESGERLAPLSRRRSKLSAEEAALLRKAFPRIFDEHYDLVTNHLRRWRLADHDVEELLQETFLALHGYILEHGFPDSIPAMLRSLADGRYWNFDRARERSLLDTGLPSSGSEKPRSGFDIDRALDLHRLVRAVLPKLSPEHRDVVDKVILNGLTYGAAAEELGIPEDTLKSRLRAAKDVLLGLLDPLLPASQRGPR